MSSKPAYRSRFNRILAASAVATSVVLGGVALASGANAEPDFDISQLRPCTEYMDADGNMAPGVEACLPVDPFTEPDLTVAQRLHLLNPESPIYQQMVQEIMDKYGK
ncbi:hypothetical protein F5X71_07720 [Nocardia brasiliensis]|uniref:Secreted protein n=1 Tax=Nocardia brasiliensis TaxID=37326 RepID=A0A6G9XMU8_NOCBR|nr:hypothetical protein [Nocardia brasiliensis]QIS02218.1 hypothetical protein F5X71_07720 [Nocardia brasiliensis]